MKIAKLILNYNTPNLTEDLCRMVPDAIVVDNGSDIHPTNIKLRNRIIPLEKNLGFTRGWNAALKILLKEKQYDAFWLMNSDIQITHQCIDRVQMVMDTNRYPIMTPSYNCWMKQCQNQGTGGVREIKCLEFCAPVIRRDVFEKIGLFDEHFSLGSGVDFDFCIRALKAGIKVFCDDSSSFTHLHHKTITTIGSLSDYSRRATIEMNKGMAELHGRNWKDLIKFKLNINRKGTIDMKKIAVYTTIFGAYDDLKPVPKQIMQADYFCITDNAARITQDGGADKERWEIIQVNTPRSDLHPRMRAKFFKAFPWEVEQLLGYEAVIFFDGSVQVNSPDFIEYCVSNLKSDFLLFRHPHRKCIYDEATHSRTMVKYETEDMENQVEYYRKFHPANFGLWACTVMVRKPTERIKALMMSWFHENIKFTWQDQLSMPVVLRVHHITPDVFPGDLYNNKYFKVVVHADRDDQKLVGSEKKRVGLADDRNRWMNYIIEKLGYKSYLEIGHRSGDSFYPIKCEKKISVDPERKPGKEPDFLMTSDEFFSINRNKFDMIFIDGDHEHSQVVKDLKNSLEFLSDHGCVVLHDTNPPSERYIEKDMSYTAYRVLVDIMRVGNIHPFTLTLPNDEGNGITVIFKQKRQPWFNDWEEESFYDFMTFNEHRQAIANLVSEDEFKKIIDQKAEALKSPVKKSEPKKSKK